MARLGQYIFLVALACLLIPSKAADNNYPHYITVEDCDEVCPANKDTECKLDCLFVDANGNGHDCVMHFYRPDGTIEYHCWE